MTICNVTPDEATWFLSNTYLIFEIILENNRPKQKILGTVLLKKSCYIFEKRIMIKHVATEN